MCIWKREMSKLGVGGYKIFRSLLKTIELLLELKEKEPKIGYFEGYNNQV